LSRKHADGAIQQPSPIRVLPPIMACAITNAPSSDFHVVRDVHEVVDLRPGPDCGSAEGPAIDAGVRADLHVVFDYDCPEVRKLLRPTTFAALVAEAVSADHRSRMDGDVAADPASVVYAHRRV
jgi:hypothetical protein